jgi:Arc/MetJ-type ribon-helix-helix transcriptional regulator
MVRYLLRIDDDIFWREVKVRAAQVGKPISDVIRELLKKWLGEKK